MLPSQVSNREPGVYTAQEKTKGVHLAPEARRKRAASKAFEHVINVRTDYGRFRTRIFYACGVTCAARKSGDPLGCLSKFGETPETAVQYSLEKAGSAITITTLSLALGTLILVASNTFYYQNVAMLLTPIIVVALLLDLFFLPTLLVKFDNWWENRPERSET